MNSQFWYGFFFGALYVIFLRIKVFRAIVDFIMFISVCTFVIYDVVLIILNEAMWYNWLALCLLFYLLVITGSNGKRVSTFLYIDKNIAI